MDFSLFLFSCDNLEYFSKTYISVRFNPILIPLLKNFSAANYLFKRLFACLLKDQMKLGRYVYFCYIDNSMNLILN